MCTLMVKTGVKILEADTDYLKISDFKKIFRIG